MIRALLAGGLLLAAPAVVAHPHLFVEAEVVVRLGPDGVQAVHVTWTYDEFFSLLMTEELGIDEDLDGDLATAEIATLADFVTDWPEGYEGDLYIESAGRPVLPGDVHSHDATFEAGQIIESFTRPVQAEMAQPLVLRIYDPGYYTAYTVTDVRIEGRDDCAAQIARADLIAATEKVDELLYAMPQGQAEIEFPMVGEDFADTVTITCAG